mmetsp:Transcript_117976/g.328765  ORF Transcript_117976/g.328765 Transcript_117976/m.328765 type:complete len:603 (-) Transcript_117976:79-1887(-)
MLCCCPEGDKQYNVEAVAGLADQDKQWKEWQTKETEPQGQDPSVQHDPSQPGSEEEHPVQPELTQLSRPSQWSPEAERPSTGRSSRPSEEEPQRSVQHEHSQVSQSSRLSQLSRVSLRRSEAFRVDSEALLRAVPLSSVMAWGGAVFADSAGTDDTFAMSSTASSLHTFVSHNWSTGRVYKFLLLAQHFNTRPAMGVALLVQAACMILIVETHSKAKSDRLHWNYKRGLVWAFPVYQLALHFGRQLVHVCGLQGPALFLDKACIHQTDEAIKRRGVRKIGAFIRASSNLLVCYSDTYLKRLWTVYEVACFLVVHEVSRIHFVPLLQPVFVLVFSTAVWLVILLNEFFQQVVFNGKHHLFPIMSPVLNATAILGCVAVATLYSRRWVRVLAQLRTVMAEFDVLQADCSDEADRAEVEGNILVMMKHVAAGGQGESLGRDELLLFFNDFVKEKLPDAILAATGRVGIRYELLMVTFLPIFSDLLDYWARSMAWNGRLNVVEFVVRLATYLGMLPLICVLHMAMMRQCLGLKGLREAFYLGMAMIVTTVMSGCLYLLPMLLLPFAAESAVVAAVLVAASCLLVGATAVLFRPLGVAIRRGTEAGS